MRFFIYTILGIVLAGGLMASAQPASAANTGYPYVIGITSGIYSTSTSHIIPIAESTTPSLYLVCLVENAGITITWPTGWREMFTHDSFGGATQHCAYAFTANGVETNSITISLSATAAINYATYRILNAAAIEWGSAVRGTNTAPNPPSLTAATSDKRLWIEAIAWNSATNTLTFSASYTLYLVSKAGNAQFQALGSRELTAQTEDPAAGTLSGSSSWSANTISISPGTELPPTLFVDFTINPVDPAPGENVSFTLYIIGGTSPYSVAWNFGDGTTSTSQSPPEKSYSLAHTYQVSIVVVDSSVIVLAKTAIHEVRVGALTGPSANALPSINLLALILLASIWLIGAIAGTIMRAGFFVILGGISALAFAITAWTTTGELFSSTLLFAAAVLTLAWVPFMADRERTPE